MELTEELKKHIVKALKWYEVDHVDHMWFSKEEDLAMNKFAKKWMAEQEVTSESLGLSAHLEIGLGG